MLKYWLKLTRTENCIFKNIYEVTLLSCNEEKFNNWLGEIREILISIGMIDVWNYQSVENETLLFFFLIQFYVPFKIISAHMRRANQ